MSIIPLTTEEFSEQIKAYYQKYNKLIQKRIEGKVDQKIKIITRDPKSKTLTGTIDFFEDNTEKTLSFDLITEHHIYTEKIFLPISISLHDAQKKIQNEIEIMNSDIIEFLEYGETKQINMANLKNLKLLLKIIVEIKNDHVKLLLLEKNRLFQEEMLLLKKDKEFLTALKQHPEQEYKNRYFANHFRLDHTVKPGQKQLIVAGSIVLENGTEQEVVNVRAGSDDNIQLKNGSIISIDTVEPIPGIRLKIRKLKVDEDLVSIETIRNALMETPELFRIFFKLMDMGTAEFELDGNRRPFLSYTLTAKESAASPVPKKMRQTFIEKPFIEMIPLQYDPENKIFLGSNAEKECLEELLFRNLNDVQIDDFTFRSIAHYHAASQFYNRTDMDETLRYQHNQTFIRFSKEYLDSDSLYDLPVFQLADLSFYTPFKKSYLWDTSMEGVPSASSLFLRKAIFAKTQQSSDYKSCLLETGNAGLYEKKAKNTYQSVPELMEIRQFIMDGTEPPYMSFHYDPELKSEFDARSQAASVVDLHTSVEEEVAQKMLQKEADDQVVEIQKLQKLIEDQEKQKIAMFRRAIYAQKYVIGSKIELNLQNSLYTAILQNLSDQDREIPGLTIQQCATSISNIYAQKLPHDKDTIDGLANMTNTNTNLQLELLSEFLCVHIVVISSNGIQTISYTDDPATLCQTQRAHISIGRLDGFEHPLFFSLLPDLSQRDECVDYLWDTNSNMLLHELPDDEQEYVGIWIPDERAINKTDEMPEFTENAELKMQVLQFCIIKERTYYKSTQVIFK